MAIEDRLTTAEAAKELGVIPRRVLAMIHADLLDAIKPGHGWFITRESVEQVKQTQRTAGKPRQSRACIDAGCLGRGHTGEDRERYGPGRFVWTCATCGSRYVMVKGTPHSVPAKEGS